MATIRLRGFKTEEQVLAISVTLRGRTIPLRNEQGQPLWMRGRQGKGPPR